MKGSSRARPKLRMGNLSPYWRVCPAEATAHIMGRVCDFGRIANLRASIIAGDVLQNLGVAPQICALTRDCTHVL